MKKSGSILARFIPNYPPNSTTATPTDGALPPGSTAFDDVAARVKLLGQAPGLKPWAKRPKKHGISVGKMAKSLGNGHGIIEFWV